MGLFKLISFKKLIGVAQDWLELLPEIKNPAVLRRSQYAGVCSTNFIGQ